MSEETSQDNAQVQETAPVTKATKTKVVNTNLIEVTAAEIEGLSKTKALKMAATLADDIENNYFKLGGVLRTIHQNSWFEGFESFDRFVYENFGFQKRKAEYLMEIYDQLVSKMIPWEKVSSLGWTKLKDLAKTLTQENVDEWVDKASKVSVIELQAMLKATLPTGEQSSTATTSDTMVKKFVLKNDQIETVNSALASVKAATGTDHDNVALENLCAGYLAGVTGTVHGGDDKPANLAEQMKAVGYERVLELFDQLWPEIDLEVDASKLTTT